MALPFASAVHGRRPANPNNWVMDRSNRPLGRGNTENELAAAMYANNNVQGGIQYAGGLANLGDMAVGGRNPALQGPALAPA